MQVRMGVLRPAERRFRYQGLVGSVECGVEEGRGGGGGLKDELDELGDGRLVQGHGGSLC